jgi:hypothetical protein
MSHVERPEQTGAGNGDSRTDAPKSSTASELRPWRLPPEAIEFYQPDAWYKGDYCHRFPFNRAKTVEDVLQGWKPACKLITSETKVLAFGSCFAAYFIQFLKTTGYNRWQTPEEQHSPVDENLLVAIHTGFENVFVILQQFRWAFHQFTPNSSLWFTKDKKLFEATEERREKIGRSLREADVFVITLGLSEVWYDEIEGEPMWRAIPKRLYEPGRHICRPRTVAETVAAFHDFDALVDRFLPEKRFVFTLSPIPLAATFRNQSAITANQASKAILRAALDEFLSDPEVARKSRYHYFPSYEIVFNLCDRPFMPDNEHVRPEVAQTVLNIFSNLYTDLPPVEIRMPDEASHVRGLEDQVRALSADLKAKEQVIRDLDQAARERLDLIGRQERLIQELDLAARERLELIERLNRGLLRRLIQSVR